MIGQDWHPVWARSALPWECDELGHINARFYLIYTVEALAGLAACYGMPDAFKPHADATIAVSSSHIRYIREALSNTPLIVRGSFLSIAERTATIGMMMFNEDDGALAASVLFAVECVEPDGTPRAWPAAVRRAAEVLPDPAPALQAMTRGLSIDVPPFAPSLALADQAGFMATGQGVFLPQDCDVFGRVRADCFLSRVTDSSRLMARRCNRVIAASGPGMDAITAAGVESHITTYRFPGAGDHFVGRSGLIEMRDKTRRVQYWILDPVTGQPWATMESLEVNFDLAARRSFALPPAALAALAPMIVALPDA